MSTIDALKIAYDVLRKANQLEPAVQIQDLREELLDLRTQNHNLKLENAELQKNIQLKSQIIFEDNICWITDDEMRPDKGRTPICPQCWQLDQKVNRLPIERNSTGSYINCSQKGHDFVWLKRMPTVLPDPVFSDLNS